MAHFFFELTELVVFGLVLGQLVVVNLHDVGVRNLAVVVFYPLERALVNVLHVKHIAEVLVQSLGSLLDSVRDGHVEVFQVHVVYFEQFVFQLVPTMLSKQGLLDEQLVLGGVLRIRLRIAVHLGEEGIDRVSFVVMCHLLGQINVLSQIGIDQVVLKDAVFLLFVLDAAHFRRSHQETLCVLVKSLNIPHLLLQLVCLLLFKRLLTPALLSVLLGKEDGVLGYHLLGVVRQVPFHHVSKVFFQLDFEAGFTFHGLLLVDEVRLASRLVAELAVCGWLH